MKLKKKEEQNVDASVLLRRENKTGEEVQGQRVEQGSRKRSTDTFSPEEIHVMQSQNQALLVIPRNAYWQEPDMDVSSEALPESYR